MHLRKKSILKALKLLLKNMKLPLQLHYRYFMAKEVHDLLVRLNFKGYILIDHMIVPSSLIINEQEKQKLGKKIKNRRFKRKEN